MDQQNTNVICCCSVLLEEVTSLRFTWWPEWRLHHLASMLHMRPVALEQTLQDFIRQEEGNKVVLVYGDCCPLMARIEQIPGVTRTMGINCCELLLGKTVYMSLMRKGVFFLLPEWTQRWEEVFIHELGLSPHNAKDFMQEMHQRLIYLDTGLVPVPLETLRDISQYCGLPYDTLPVTCEILQARIQDAMNRLVGGNK